MQRRLLSWTALLLAGAFAGSGCGRGPVKVEGVVTFDGKPAENAVVVFAPLEGRGRYATGITNQDGYYRMFTEKLGDGVFPGEYKITVSREKSVYPLGFEFSSMMSEETMHKMGIDFYKKAIVKSKQAPKKSAPQDLPPLPKVYGSDTTTPLQCTVPVPGGKLNLELTSKGGS